MEQTQSDKKAANAEVNTAGDSVCMETLHQSQEWKENNSGPTHHARCAGERGVWAAGCPVAACGGRCAAFWRLRGALLLEGQSVEMWKMN